MFANSVNATLNLCSNSTDKLEVDGSLILPHSLSLHQCSILKGFHPSQKTYKKTTFHERNRRLASDYGAVGRETGVIDNKFAKC